MKLIVRRIATSWALWTAAALLLVYALIGNLLAPYLIGSEEKTDRATALDDRVDQHCIDYLLYPMSGGFR